MDIDPKTLATREDMRKLREDMAAMRKDTCRWALGTLLVLIGAFILSGLFLI